jgi:hypothetical protein
VNVQHRRLYEKPAPDRHRPSGLKPPDVRASHRAWLAGPVGRVMSSSYFADANYGGTQGALDQAALEQQALVTSQVAL